MPFLLLILGGLKSAVGFIGGWLSRRSLTEIACIGLALLCLVQFVTIRGEKRHSAKLETALVKCEAARKADRTAYERAQTEAAAKNKAQVKATEQQYQRNNDEAVANLNARLERLRSELRHNPAPKGSAGQSRPPSADNPAGAAGEARVCLAAADVLRAAENEERHDELITLVLKQMAVDPNK